MKWNRFTLKTKTDAEDMVICTLAEVGIEGVEIQDKKPLTEEDKAQMFVDIMPEGPADDGIAYLNFYLEEEEDLDTCINNLGNFYYWCASRMLSLDRKYAKEIPTAIRKTGAF